MKLFFNLLTMAAAGFLGYVAEPRLRLRLTGVEPSAIEKAENTKVLLQLPGGLPQVDPSTLTPEQLPQRVLLNSDVKVSDTASGVTMSLGAGNRVKLVRIEGGNAVVSPGEGPFLGRVPITGTDLLQQIAARRTTASPQVSPTVPSVEEIAPPPVPSAAELIEPPESVVAPVKESPPEVVTEPAAPAPAEVSNASPDSVRVMQESIKAAQVKEFTFDQVLNWRAEADEVVDGETYQVGIASYKATTIFGVKTIQAKALIKGGQVQRWIWAKSGMEIK